MRVLIACPSYPPQDMTCGVGDYTRCLAEELVRRGDQVTVVASARWRGPGHGAVTVLPILDALRIPYHVLRDAGEIPHVVKQIIQTMEGQKIPVAILVPPFILVAD